MTEDAIAAVPVECRASDGVTLTGSLLGDRAADQTLVLVHGGGGSRRSMIPQGRALADRFRVLLPDIRGYGGSICREQERHSWSRYAADIVEWLDWLQVSTAFVGGASLGAGVSVRTALDSPQRVSGLVLISVHHDGGHADDDQVAHTRALADRFVAEGTGAVMEPFFASLPAGQATMAREEAAIIDDQSAAAALEAIVVQEPFEPITELAQIGQPTLIIPGDDDLHPSSLAMRYAEVIPNAHLADVIDGWGDETTPESRATALTPMIVDFIEKC